MRGAMSFVVAAALFAAVSGCKQHRVSGVSKTAGAAGPPRDFGDEVDKYARKLFEEGQDTFRSDTFGSEAFWGGQLKLHNAIKGEGYPNGVGPGLSARDALKLGLKVDVKRLPSILSEAIQGGSVDLDDVETTLELLRADAVVGVEGFFEGDDLIAVGITCAFCHSTVDDSLTVGIGRRLDGWPN